MGLRFEGNTVEVRVKMTDPPPPVNIPINYWYNTGSLNTCDPDFFIKLRNLIATGSLN